MGIKRTVNGQSWQHMMLSVSAGGFDFAKFSKLNFKTGAQKEPTRDSMGDIDGFVIKEKTTEAALATTRREWELFMAYLAQAKPDVGILQVKLDLTCTIGDSLATLSKHELLGTMFQEDPFASESNQDQLIVEVPLFVPRIRSNGREAILY